MADGRPERSERWRGGGRHWLRRALTVVVLGVGIAVVVDRAGTLSSAVDRIGDARWPWVVLAVGFEAASMVVFARLQRWLLRAGGVRVPLRTMVELTLAGNALAATLPGGVAWSAAWVFDQLRRRGVERFLRIWVFLVAGAVSSFALFVVVAVGVEVAGAHGPVADLRWAVAALAAVPLVALAAVPLARRDGVRALGARLVAVVRRGRRGRWVVARVEEVVAKLRRVHLGPLGWLEAFGLGLLNWVDDAAVLALVMVALRIGVPWRGIFVVYGVTQIAAAIPLTPGGLGVVEGSLVGLLAAYGVPTTQAVAVTLLYRIISFWGLVPIGWGVWLALDVGTRRSPRTHPWAEHHHGPLDAEPARRSGRWAPAPCTVPSCDALPSAAVPSLPATETPVVCREVGRP